MKSCWKAPQRQAQRKPWQEVDAVELAPAWRRMNYPEEAAGTIATLSAQTVEAAIKAGPAPGVQPQRAGAVFTMKRVL